MDALLMIVWFGSMDRMDIQTLLTSAVVEQHKSLLCKITIDIYARNRYPFCVILSQTAYQLYCAGVLSLHPSMDLDLAIRKSGAVHL
jgi:hypothetical protein